MGMALFLITSLLIVRIFLRWPSQAGFLHRLEHISYLL